MAVPSSAADAGPGRSFPSRRRDVRIMDLAFGRHGRLYVLEIDADGLLNPSADGALIAVDRDGTKHPVDLPAGTLTHPGGLTVTRRAAYVSNTTIDAGVGQVLRIGLGG